MAFCNFGKTIKKKLVDIDKTQEWLIEQVKSLTGMYFDSGYLQRILRGERTAEKIVKAIIEVLDLSEEEVQG